jgi:hypothetical protein
MKKKRKNSSFTSGMLDHQEKQLALREKAGICVIASLVEMEY